MNGQGTLAVAPVAASDAKLVAAVRGGDDGAFEELYRRYERRIASFVRRLLRDEARAEDVTQEAFFSALKRLRATDAEIVFKPWIYEIARNGAIDAYRRTSRTEEVSISADDLRPADRRLLVGSTSPDSALLQKERLENLRGALDELPESHHRILVLRELEGLSYREIGERLELTRPAVESALFRARRRLEREYEELDTGRRCEAIRTVIGRMAEGVESEADARRLRRHARRCILCRRLARELGVEPLAPRGLAARAAALLPLPAFLRRRVRGASGAAASGGGKATSTAGGLLGTGGHLTAAVGEKAAAIVAAAALAGAGSAVIGGLGPLGGAGRGHHDAHHGGRSAAAGGGSAATAPGGSSHAGPAAATGASWAGSVASADPAGPGGAGARSGDPGGGSALGGVQLIPELPVPEPGLPRSPSLPSAPSVGGPASEPGGPSAPAEVPSVQLPSVPTPPDADLSGPRLPEAPAAPEVSQPLETPPEAKLPAAPPSLEKPLRGGPQLP